ncbi:RRP12-like protein [Homarus americanus]|uniref:RRP12-like protein-like n=1 Tax=Homarus americanus TaxID=6706 RepID=A0A8J5K0K3_HOMAM|nr:RRP12-like protein [Homarus americanus]XP_042228602.1 RRP12-like protein [Homarus americanus]KAG7165273.1 RRP12-like protein-like [Homarus americanus]
MKLKRISGKGKKWKKGQSCVSNADNTKHRESARGCFFQKVQGESYLTKGALAEHDAALGNIQQQMEDLCVDGEDLRSAGKTFNTFATNFTSCTIPAFDKFFRNFSTTSELHTRMLAIHAASQEYMKEAGMPETSTSYYCSLMISLEGISDSEDDVAATLSLMVKVIRRVSVEVLRVKYGEFAKALDTALTLYQSSINVTLITNAIGSLSVLLRAQERVQWTYPYTMELLHKILLFTSHEKPKIRKTAQYNISAILKGSSFMVDKDVPKCSHPAAGAVAEFCVSQLRDSSEMGNAKTTLHFLVFLRQVIMAFPKKQLKSVCECVLSIMQLGKSLTNTCAMQAFYSLFVSEPSPAVFPADTNSALICALTTEGAGLSHHSVAIIPGINDPQPASAWMTVLTVAHINLFKLNEELGMKYIASWFEQLVPYWQSDHDEVQTKVFESFEALIQECVGNCSKEYLASDQGQIAAIFRVVEGGLSFQFQSAWGHVFKCISVCFTVIGPNFPAMMEPCLKNLTELMENPHLPHRAYLEQAIGAAVRALGPKSLMAVVPLQVTGNVTEDEKRFWVLPILKKYVKNTQLCYFEDYFVHLAGKCFVLLDSLKEKGQEDSLLAKTYQTVERQVWAMLPSFCDKATDVDQSLSNEKFARILCDHIKFRDDTRTVVMEALRNMINDNIEHPGKLAIYSKNYIPALFNVYLTPPKDKGSKDSGEPTMSAGQRQAAHYTIKTYLQIVPIPKCNEFLGLIMTKYNDENDSFKKQAFLDLARAFLPYLDSNLLQRLYEKVSPLVRSAKDHREQKAAYRLLEELLGVGTEGGQDFIMKNLEGLSELLLKSLASAAPSSRAPRLRSVRQVLLQLKTDMEEESRDAFLNQVVGECVMCCGKKMSVATRKAAFLLLSEVGATIQKHRGCSGEDTVRHCLKLLMAGLVGSPVLAANSVLAITALTYQYRDIISDDMIELLVQNMCVQLMASSREIVGSCLSFIKSSFIIFPVPVMSSYVDTIVKALCNMVPDCQRRFRLKTRDILDRLMRKFGADRIAALVPRGNTALQKRIRNLRKIAARKQRERDARKQSEDVSDDEDFTSRALPASLDEILAEIDTDNEEDEEEGATKSKGKGKGRGKQEGKKKKKITWIKEDTENIVDLLDASAGQALVSKRPTLKAARDRGASKEDGSTSGFQVDKGTGKFIIKEDNSKEKKDSVSKMDFMEDIDEFLGMKAGAQGGKIKNRKRTFSGGSSEQVEPPVKVATVTTGKDGKKKVSKKAHDYGSEFRSKKAGGDMMKKGKVSPYAYVQFSKDRLNKRKKAKYEGQFTSLVKGARKGVAKGSKKKGRNKK